MARPPARAGGRSGLLTGGESGKPNGSSLPSPKGYLPRPQPAQPVGGPLRAFQCEGRRPGIPSEVQPPPHNPTREGGPGGEPPPRGFFPPFLSKKWGPGRAGPVPRRSNAGTTPQTPPQTGQTHPGSPAPPAPQPLGQLLQGHVIQEHRLPHGRVFWGRSTRVPRSFPGAGPAGPGR